MRKINLRAWDELNKIMHYDFQFISSGNNSDDWIVFTSDKQKLNSIPHPLDNPYFNQQFKITEGIGLRDSHGKEFYVDDLVQTDTDIKIVNYNPTLACYGVRSLKGGGTMSIDSSWEIIGNIYENPQFIIINYQ